MLESERKICIKELREKKKKKEERKKLSSNLTLTLDSFPIVVVTKQVFSWKILSCTLGISVLD